MLLRPLDWSNWREEAILSISSLGPTSGGGRQVSPPASPAAVFPVRQEHPLQWPQFPCPGHHPGPGFLMFRRSWSPTQSSSSSRQGSPLCMPPSRSCIPLESPQGRKEQPECSPVKIKPAHSVNEYNSSAAASGKHGSVMSMRVRF